MKKIERCQYCRFWEQPDPDQGIGYCRRYPPNTKEQEDEFPVTGINTWCGEYESE